MFNSFDNEFEFITKSANKEFKTLLKYKEFKSMIEHLIQLNDIKKTKICLLFRTGLNFFAIYFDGEYIKISTALKVIEDENEFFVYPMLNNNVNQFPLDIPFVFLKKLMEMQMNLEDNDSQITFKINLNEEFVEFVNDEQNKITIYIDQCHKEYENYIKIIDNLNTHKIHLQLSLKNSLLLSEDNCLHKHYYNQVDL